MTQTPPYRALRTDKLIVCLRLARGDLSYAKTAKQRILYGDAIAAIRAELERRGMQVPA